MVSSLRHLFLFILSACIATLLALPVQAQTNTQDSDTSEVLTPQAPVAVDPVNSDTDIQNRISAIIDATGWYQDITIQVQEGVVFLDGVADTDAREEWVRQLAAKTTGVVAVVNRMTVDELGASTINIKTYYWFDGLEISAIKLKSALLRLVKSNLTEAGISMPDEAREVIFPDGVQVRTQVEHVDSSAASVAALPEPDQPPAEPDQTGAEADLKNDFLPPQSDDDRLEEDANDLLASR
ncbi:BON domain-containing protein [Yoonia maricola]|uniref:BON domain-containing protein n=1 Tax=Yoonia maricola TaxID=420999 RepID=A0A2M8W0Q3_9RHOB|nr:BON domain-containing protein [Yoonia maricola]